jgi:hypothetical protein
LYSHAAADVDHVPAFLQCIVGIYYLAVVLSDHQAGRIGDFSSFRAKWSSLDIPLMQHASQWSPDDVATATKVAFHQHAPDLRCLDIMQSQIRAKPSEPWKSVASYPSGSQGRAAGIPIQGTSG